MNTIIVMYKLIDSGEQEKEFQTIADVVKWVDGISSEMFEYISISDDKELCIESLAELYQLHNDREKHTPKEIIRDIPKYMFETREVTPTTWIDLQAMKLDCYMLAEGTALLVDPKTRNYCFVFWDEGQQCSNPYPTHVEAIRARDIYIANM